MSEAPPPLPPASPDPYGGYPYAAGAPMASLAYSIPVQSARPGIITAIGVISIVVASISLLGNLWTAMTLLTFAMMASFAGAMGGATPGGGPFGPPVTPPAQVATTGPFVQSTTIVAVESSGLEAGDRAAVAAGLAELQFLSAPRLQQLDALLAMSGKDIFPTLKSPAASDAIGQLVLGHGASPSSDPNAPGPDYFRTKQGRVELYDDRAVYYPANGADAVRSSTLTTTNPGLTAAQVQGVVQQAQAASGNTMNPAQVAALNNLLSAPGQQFVSPINVPTAIRSATALGDGSVMVMFPSGYATFGAQGQTTSGNAASMAVATPFSRVKLNGAALALSGFATIAGLGLAIYLLVIGILVLRQSPRGRKFHLYYAVLKIPVTILGAAAAWWLMTSFMEAMLAGMGPAAPPAGTMSASLGFQQLVFGVLGLIYPIALLIVLQSRAVKDYYNTVVN